MDIIERGTVLDTKINNIVINDDYDVIKDKIIIGSLKNNLVYFKQSKLPKPSEIEEIVYINKYIWGYKQFTNPLHEFNKLNNDIQQEILSEYLHNQLNNEG